MSSRRKKNAREAARRRIENSVGRSDAMSRAIADPDLYVSTLPEVERRNYFEVAELLDRHPDLAESLTARSVDDMLGLITALAYPDMVGNPDEANRLQAAGQIRMWHILQRLDIPFDHWPTNIVAMTNEQIIEQINTDRDNGTIPRPTDNGSILRPSNE